jgi:hypothetical protein
LCSFVAKTPNEIPVFHSRPFAVKLPTARNHCELTRIGRTNRQLNHHEAKALALVGGGQLNSALSTAAESAKQIDSLTTAALVVMGIPAWFNRKSCS